MAIRITGMNSGLDTENIISELVKVKRSKVDTLKKKQTSQQWKTDAWKDLNTKVLKLYNGALTSMSFSDAYAKKTTKVSNSNAVSVVTSGTAVNGVQELKVNKLAKSGYLTGAQLDGSVTGKTKLSDLTKGAAGDEISFSVTVGGKTKEINLTGASTINDVVTKLKDAGVNANFDEKNQRFYVSSKETGAAADFAITANNQNGFDALTKMGINLADAATTAQYEKLAGRSVDARKALINAEVTKQVKALTSQLESMEKSSAAYDQKINKFYEDNEYGYDDKTDFEEVRRELAAEKERLAGEEDEESKAALATLDKQIAAIDSHTTNVANKALVDGEIAATEKQIGEEGKGSNDLVDKITQAMTAKFEYADTVNAAIKNGDTFGFTDSKEASRIVGQDAEIYLNDAKYTSKSNVFEINGLTLTVSKETAEGESVMITTEDDTSGIYDMIKNFLKEYNSIINEMDKLYNAPTAKSYQPLTDEEKDAMTDTEVEKWEAKIKDSVLRRDSTLNTVSGALKDIMSSSIDINGKKLNLSSFGIETLSYFTAPENEKNAYHIAGDADDSSTMSQADVLKGMIASDPSTVSTFFTELSRNLSDKLKGLMSATDYSSSFTLYDDKRMKDEYASYTEKIKKQEEKVTAMENKYYKQFSAMETALAKLQSSQSAISGLLGM